jgi:hypothetical protein
MTVSEARDARQAPARSVDGALTELLQHIAELLNVLVKKNLF